MPHHHRPTPRSSFLRAGILAAIVLIGLLGGLGYGALRPAAYSADAHVLVTAPASEGPIATSFAQAYGRLATLPETLALASPPLPAASLDNARKHLQVSTSPDAPLIRLTGSGRTPGQAARFANAAATALMQYGNVHRGDTGVRVVMMNRAAPPRLPSGPGTALTALVGAAAGTLLALLVIATGWDRRWHEYLRSAVGSRFQNDPEQAEGKAASASRTKAPRPRRGAETAPADVKAKKTAAAAKKKTAAKPAADEPTANRTAADRTAAAKPTADEAAGDDAAGSPESDRREPSQAATK
ncbi:hypothetical protein [Spirillospora sp. NPDC047279]|uniref:hypothetical protein n=1 Tax=Spirillospora sp. NPDC047279 TaxID=3155478 RepID=UPI0033DA18B7